MKVCIIGAGISGLSCALTLEKHGIVPDIYEQYDKVGGRVPFITCLLQLMNRPIEDPLIELSKSFGITITPINILDKLVMFSPNETAIAKGFLGYIFERGPYPNSMEYEMYSKVSARIKYNSTVDYKELVSQYDWVIVATGSPYVAKELGCWTDTFRSWVKGAVVEGNFDPTTWIAWFNKSYANNGYAYLGPFSSTKASIVLISSDVKEEEIESRWKMFLSTEKLNYHIKQSFILEHITGTCYPKQINNIIFVGNAAGLMESLLGFGIYNGIISGVMAAKAICDNSSYQEIISFLDKSLHNSNLLRQGLNKLTNKDFNHLFGLLKIPMINNIVYNTNIDVLKLNAKILEFFH